MRAMPFRISARDPVVQREQLRRLLEIRERVFVSLESEEDAAEHPQRLPDRRRGAPAEIDGGAIGLDRGIDPPLL
jgi:hypothetical protein